MWSSRSMLVRFIRDKFKSPRLNTVCNPPIYPPPGLGLKAPDEWEVSKYFDKIGGDLEEHADKFETVAQVLQSDGPALKEKGIPARQRRYILRITEMLRRGVLSFEVLDKRTCVKKQ